MQLSLIDLLKMASNLTSLAEAEVANASRMPSYLMTSALPLSGSRRANTLFHGRAVAGWVPQPRSWQNVCNDRQKAALRVTTRYPVFMSLETDGSTCRQAPPSQSPRPPSTRNVDSPWVAVVWDDPVNLMPYVTLFSRSCSVAPGARADDAGPQRGAPQMLYRTRWSPNAAAAHRGTVGYYAARFMMERDS